MLLKLILLVLYSTSSVQAFIPTEFRLFILDRFFDDDGPSVSHPAMTCSAMLQVAADVLLDNPNPNNNDSSQDIKELLSGSSLSAFRLVNAYYGSSASLSSRARRGLQLERAIDVVKDFNTRVDADELGMAAAHFDSEQFADGQRRLIEFREIIARDILQSRFESARRIAGRLLHTLQDFYSHSNWIENHVGENILPHYAVLGQRGRRIENVAPPNRPTCQDCIRDGDVALGRLLSLLPFIETTSCYNCNDNLERSLQSEQVLTSGYSDGGRDAQNNFIPKPPGKCSHGGLIDGTTDSSATGGINKDSTHRKFASHFNLHRTAAIVAQQHSQLILTDIRNDVDNDALFGEFLGLEITEARRVIDLTIVIDITRRADNTILTELQESLSDAADDIQRYTDTIEDEIQVRYILIPLDDSGPGSTFETDSISQLLSTIGGLSVQSNGDGNVPIVNAVLRAAEASEQDSSIFVFTESTASDEERLTEAEAIIAEKNLKVFFIETFDLLVKRSLRSRRNKRHQKRQADQELVTFSGGQSLSVQTDDISGLSTFISFSTVESSATLFRQSGSAVTNADFSFSVDSYTMRVLILINGRSLGVSVTTPQGIDASTLMQYSISLESFATYVAVVNITDASLFGQWTITLTSIAPYSIRVLGDSEIMFTGELVYYNPRGMDEINDFKPLAGILTSVMLTVMGTNSSVTISGFNLVNSEGVIQPVDNFTRTGNDSYIGIFVPPMEEFQFQIVGMDDNAFNFSYVGSISVEPTTISLTYGTNDTGFVLLARGTNTTVRIVLFNAGPDNTFRLAVNTDASSIEIEFFQYSLTPQSVSVNTNSSAEITVQISVAPNAPIGLSVSFTLAAQSTTNVDASDYITFDMIATQDPNGGLSINLSQLEMTMMMMSSLLLLLYNLL